MGVPPPHRPRRQGARKAAWLVFDVYLPERMPTGFRRESARAIDVDRAQWVDVAYREGNRYLFLLEHPPSLRHLDPPGCARSA